jgi:hypothetical protein
MLLQQPAHRQPVQGRRRILIAALGVVAAAVIVLVAVAVLNGGGNDKASQGGRVSVTTSEKRAAATSTSSLPSLSAVRPISQSEVNTITARLFEGQRQPILDAAQKDSSIEAVRDLSYDGVGNVINVDILSTYQSRPETYRTLYDQQAWALASAFSTGYWSPVVVDALTQRGGTPAMLPTFHLRLEDVLDYRCTPEQMVAFGAKRAGMQDFLAQCVTG